MIRLLIKTHNKTGLKYLCKTEKTDWESYLGSGKYWRRHLKQHGNDIKTELLFETENKDDFRKFAKQKSIEFDIINSNEWANLVNEEGDGGNTVGNKRWVTNGQKECFYNGQLPKGWRYGRSDACSFKDPKIQSKLSKRVDTIKRGQSIKKCWDAGNFNRDNSKCGSKGEKNPSKRPEVKEKIRAYALSKSEERSERMKKNKVWEKRIR